MVGASPPTIGMAILLRQLQPTSPDTPSPAADAGGAGSTPGQRTKILTSQGTPSKDHQRDPDNPQNCAKLFQPLSFGAICSCYNRKLQQSLLCCCCSGA